MNRHNFWYNRNIHSESRSRSNLNSDTYRKASVNFSLYLSLFLFMVQTTVADIEQQTSDDENYNDTSNMIFVQGSSFGEYL